MPTPSFGEAAVPSALVPMKFPKILLPPFSTAMPGPLKRLIGVEIEERCRLHG